jgi:hypothetical protein
VQLEGLRKLEKFNDFIVASTTIKVHRAENYQVIAVICYLKGSEDGV